MVLLNRNRVFALLRVLAWADRNLGLCGAGDGVLWKYGKLAVGNLLSRICRQTLQLYPFCRVVFLLFKSRLPLRR